MTNIIIHVSGGMIQGVATNDPDTTAVFVVDMDLRGYGDSSTVFELTPEDIIDWEDSDVHEEIANSDNEAARALFAN
jgi:hypothetical protein